MTRTVKHVAPTVGLASACRALGVARGSLYRHRKPHPTCPGRSRPVFAPCAFPGRACPGLRHPARGPLLWTWNRQRCMPCCTEEGRHVCSVRDHVPAASRCPRSARAPQLVDDIHVSNRPGWWPVRPTRYGRGTSPRLPGPRKWVTYPLDVVPN